jgi:hypothetical protein
MQEDHGEVTKRLGNILVHKKVGEFDTGIW